MIKVTFDNGETYTEKEFKRDLKRYFDTLFKSHAPCGLHKNCERCVFFNHGLCGESFVKAKPIENSFEIIETVYKWAQEHPYRTNEDYILETMGIELGLLTNDEIIEWLNEEYKEYEKDD